MPGAQRLPGPGTCFRLDPPLDEKLYAPWDLDKDGFLAERIPWERWNVLICPASESPRKQMSVCRWEELVGMLRERDIGVVQAGRLRDPYVRGAYSLLGLTTPRLLTGLLRRFDVIITSDNFAMHAAKLSGVPAVVLWGPTDHRVYGYSGQVHLKNEKACDEYPDGCIGRGSANLYPTPCPKEANCMNLIELETICGAVANLLEAGAAS